MVTFNGNLKSRSGNVGKLINNPNGQAILDGVTANIADDTNNNSMDAMIVSKKFKITNDSNIKSDTQRFYKNAASGGGGEVLIDGNSNVTTTGMKGGTNGQIWQILAQTNFTLSGSGTKLVISGRNTVNISGNSDFIVNNIANAGSNAGNYSAILFESGNDNNFNITGDSSNVEVTSKSGPAINAQPNTVSILV